MVQPKIQTGIVALALTMLFFLIAMEAKAIEQHYTDANNAPLPQFDSLWGRLNEFYGEALPPTIHLTISDTAQSEFAPPSNIYITSATFQNRAIETVIHESSHLANFQLTHGQSNEVSFRFIDEGFATIWQQRGTQNALYWKQLIMSTAKACKLDGKVSFALTQDWDHYFGVTPPDFRFDAYRVGASFIYFLEETFGEEKLKQFLVAIGTTRNLAIATENVYSNSLLTLETQWLDYIDTATQSSSCNLR